MSGADVVDELSAQPRCPHCTVLMRDVDHASVCPSCGHAEPHDQAVMPREFDGPTYPGG